MDSNTLLNHIRDYTALQLADLSAPTIAKLWKWASNPGELFDFAMRSAIDEALQAKDPEQHKIWIFSDIADPSEFFV